MMRVVSRWNRREKSTRIGELELETLVSISAYDVQHVLPLFRKPEHWLTASSNDQCFACYLFIYYETRTEQKCIYE